MPAPAFVASVIANGQIITGWESVTVHRDFAEGFSHFTLAPSEDGEALQLQPGDQVDITLGGHKVISGNVTSRNVAYDAMSHQILIVGKSKTMDVADSSVEVHPGSYDGYTFEQIARAVLAPHGVGLKLRNPSAALSMPFPSFSIQYGETCGEVLSRMAMMRGVWVSDDADGNIVVGQGDPNAAPVAELREGTNILRATGKMQDDSAFGRYASVSQSPDAQAAAPARWYSATQQNPNVRQNRYKLWVAPHPDSPEGLQAHVGRVTAESLWPICEVNVTVVGWFKPDGSIWDATDNITVYSPRIFPVAGGYSPTLGVKCVTFGQDSQNATTTTLECVLPQFLTSNPTNGLQDTGAGNEARSPAAPSTGSPDYSGGNIST